MKLTIETKYNVGDEAYVSAGWFDHLGLGLLFSIPVKIINIKLFSNGTRCLVEDVSGERRWIDESAVRLEE